MGSKIVLPKWTEGSLLEGILQEANALEESDFLWTDSAVADNEEVVGEADEFVRRMYTVFLVHKHAYEHAGQEFRATEDDSEEEKMAEKVYHLARVKRDLMKCLIFSRTAQLYQPNSRKYKAEVLRADGVIACVLRNPEQECDCEECSLLRSLGF